MKRLLILIVITAAMLLAKNIILYLAGAL